MQPRLTQTIPVGTQLEAEGMDVRPEGSLASKVHRSVLQAVTGTLRTRVTGTRKGGITITLLGHSGELTADETD